MSRPANARGRRMKNVEAVPVVAQGAHAFSRRSHHCHDRCAVGAVERALADDEHGVFLLDLAIVGELLQRFGAIAKMRIFVAQIGRFTDHADWQSPAL